MWYHDGHGIMDDNSSSGQRPGGASLTRARGFLASKDSNTTITLTSEEESFKDNYVEDTVNDPNYESSWDEVVEEEIDYSETKPDLEEEEEDNALSKEEEPESSQPSLELLPSLLSPSLKSFKIHITCPKMINTQRKSNLIPRKKRCASPPSSPLSSKKSWPTYR